MTSQEHITLLLARLAEGDQAAEQPLVAAVVDRLERIARGQMARQARGVTLEPRMLAHDALLKLLQAPREFDNRRHFFSYATRVMANALIDHHRRRVAEKRGGEQFQVSLSVAAGEPDIEIDRVPMLLDELEALDARSADLVRLRVFWGASMEETANLLGVSLSTVERDWRFARRWLAANL
ncbi:MAG: ECF-type sigma factor [Xanthomonadales bacterium]|nr:ECF-type sigma factor [Xanthomonadales bacterium]